MPNVYALLKVQYGNSKIMSLYWLITINIQSDWRHGIYISFIFMIEKNDSNLTQFSKGKAKFPSSLSDLGRIYANLRPELSLHKLLV